MAIKNNLVKTEKSNETITLFVCCECGIDSTLDEIQAYSELNNEYGCYKCPNCEIGIDFIKIEVIN